MPERPKVVVYVDACARGRCAGLGVYIPAPAVYDKTGFLPRPFQTGMGIRGKDSTVKNEIQALLFGIDIVTSVLEALLYPQQRSSVDIEFRTDAKVITDVLNSFAKPKSPVLRGLFGHMNAELKDLRSKFGGATVAYVNTRKNLADGMAAAAADSWNERWAKS
jgi:hypothetical protein